MESGTLSKSTVDALVKKIQDEITEGKQRAEIAVENEKTVTYWKIGRHIHEHMLEHEDRAEYGQELFKKLSEKLEIGARTLYRAVQFLKLLPIGVCDRELADTFQMKIVSRGLGILFYPTYLTGIILK